MADLQNEYQSARSLFIWLTLPTDYPICYAVDTELLLRDNISSTLYSNYDSVDVHLDVTIDNKAWYPDLGYVAKTNHNRLANILTSDGYKVVSLMHCSIFLGTCRCYSICVGWHKHNFASPACAYSLCARMPYMCGPSNSQRGDLVPGHACRLPGWPPHMCSQRKLGVCWLACQFPCTSHSWSNSRCECTIAIQPLVLCFLLLGSRISQPMPTFMHFKAE